MFLEIKLFRFLICVFCLFVCSDLSGNAAQSSAIKKIGCFFILYIIFYIFMIPARNAHFDYSLHALLYYSVYMLYI